MGSAAELTLGWRVRMHTSGSTKVLSFTGDSQKLGGYVQALEDERRKIEAFKRELPLCMQLITDAVEALKEHMSEQQQPATSISILKLSCNSEDDSNDHRSSDKSPLEDFLPSKRKLDKSRKEEGEEQLAKKGCTDVDLDKPSWMAQAQLWSQPKRLEALKPAQEKEAPKSSAVRPQAKHAIPGIFLNSTQGSGGAFSPFVRPRNSEQQTVVPTANSDLTLSSGGDRESRHSSPRSPRAEEVAIGSSQLFNGQSSVPVEATSTAGICSPSQHVNSIGAGQSSSNRKARRCWSPELHRRFVGALQQLGGSHVATPKQIREIMKVDGLTNDEVKSHLQKYRLHTRRPTATGQPATPHSAAQLVVLGGIWVPPDYAAGAQQAPGMYDQQPAYCRAPFSQDFYSHMRASAQLHQPDSSNSAEEQEEASHSRSSSPQQHGSRAEAAQSSGGESVGDGAANNSGGNSGEDEETLTKNDEHHHHQHLDVLEEEDDGDLTEAEDSRCNEATAKDKKTPVDT